LDFFIRLFSYQFFHMTVYYFFSRQTLRYCKNLYLLSRPHRRYIEPVCILIDKHFLLIMDLYFTCELLIVYTFKFVYNVSVNWFVSPIFYFIFFFLICLSLCICHSWKLQCFRFEVSQQGQYLSWNNTFVKCAALCVAPLIKMFLQ
jgi:hypothetical protein